MMAEEMQARELAEMQSQMQALGLGGEGQQDPGMAGAGNASGGFGIEQPAHGEPVLPNGAGGLTLNQKIMALTGANDPNFDQKMLELQAETDMSVQVMLEQEA